MSSYKIFFTLLLVVWKVSGGIMPDAEPECPVSMYTTPALEDQFFNFRIINGIPQDGSSGSGVLQDPVIWNDTVIIFQFKGVGNALILLQKFETDENYPNIVMIEIGGGLSNSRVAFYVSKTQGGASDQVASTEVPGITSVSEFRSFWIMVDPGNGSVCFGRGVEPNMNNIMCPIIISEFNYEVAAISISTNGMNDGMWEFVSVCGCPEEQVFDPLFGTCVDDDCGPFGSSPVCDRRGEVCRSDGACVCMNDMVRCRGPNEKCSRRGFCYCTDCLDRDPVTGFCSVAP